MIAAQLLACHNAAMECYRRAVHGEQTFVGRSENLSQANKLSRSFATLLEALNRHRGKGQQKVTVEHVHVHAGGQAVVGMVGTPGGGYHPNSEEQPDAKGKSETSVGALSMDDASLPALRGGARTRRATLCQSPAMTNGRCRMHGGASIRRGRLSAYGRTALSRSWVLLVNRAGRSQLACLYFNALGHSSPSQIGSEIAYSWPM